MQKYDYLVVGSGLFGSLFAFEAKKRGKRVLVLEKRNHIGGNLFCSEVEGIKVHQYGAHIFHTSDQIVWNYVNQFSEFNRFTNSPIANFKGEIYNLPFNMNTFNKLWGVISPEEAKSIISSQQAVMKGKEPRNLEEQAISLVGKDIYDKLIKGYTEKQWGRSCDKLPAFIIKRIPVRYTYDNNYFDDIYQGIPVDGYNSIIEKMLNGIEVQLNTDYLINRDKFASLADKVLYTGPIDAYYDFAFGELEYRSLRFETEIINQENYQGVAVINYTDNDTPFTRIIEHKHFEYGLQKVTVITREYPTAWKQGDTPYYPVNDERNQNIFKKYESLSKKDANVLFGGRLAEYKYYDMDKVIMSAINMVNKELK